MDSWTDQTGASGWVWLAFLIALVALHPFGIFVWIGLILLACAFKEPPK